MRPFDGLIFDLDGTLWDSTRPVADGFNRAAEELLQASHIPLGVSDIVGIMGMPHRQVFRTLFPRLSEQERERLAPRCYEAEIAAIRAQGATLYPGVETGIRRLGAHYRLFIVSNCQVPYLETFLETSGMRSNFVDSECHGRAGKPKAANIALIMERHDLRTVAYVGDTASDQQAAQDAGAHYHHVNYGFGQPSRPCPQFGSFTELVAYFLNQAV